MKRFITATFWVALYLAAVLLPMFVMLVSPRPTARNFWIELSLALGFVGVMQMALQFHIIARYKNITAPYGIDLIMQYHRQIALLSVAMILAHPAILVAQNPRVLALLNPLGGTWASRTGVASVIALLLLTVLSVFRKQLRLSYERWRVTHTLLGVAALGFAVAHVVLVAGYVNTLWKQALVVGIGAAAMSSLVYLRLVKPVLQKRRPYRVTEVRADRGRNFIFAVEPVGHSGLKFLPGQFAWMKVGGNPFTIEEHPFSFSSSAETRGRIEFGIKALGDFTGVLQKTPVGTQVYLDGAYGSFSIDLEPAAGYVFIAGGIGITPMISFLRTMADRGDARPALLIYGSKDWERTAFREEIETLKSRMNLRVVQVVEQAPAEWRGEVGVISRDLLARHLPKEKIRRAYFVCGPTVMMDAVEQSLASLGVPRADIHSERFDLI
jgi:predicted ferric reductase